MRRFDDAWLLPTARQRRGVMLLLAAGVSLLAGCPDRPITVPEVRGRVVDARTGGPLAGVVVKRAFLRAGFSGLVDSSPPSMIRDSRVETMTDAEGRFAFSAATIPELAGMPWVAFKSDYMPAKGCYAREDWAEYSCLGFGGFMVKDPWVKRKVEVGEDHLDLELRLWPPTTEGIEWPFGSEWGTFDGRQQVVKHFPDDVDAWGEYFRRLQETADSGWLPAGIFLAEGAAYAKTRSSASDEVLRSLETLVPAGGWDSPRWHDSRVRSVARLIVESCSQRPESKYCSRWPDYLHRLSVHLQQESADD